MRLSHLKGALVWVKEFLQKYLTFSGETDVFSILFWLGYAGAFLLTIQFWVFDVGVEETKESIALLSLLIIVASGVLVYSVWKAGKYTVEKWFHLHRGPAITTLLFLIISGFGVIILAGILSVFLPVFRVSSPSLIEVLAGIFAIVGTSAYLGGRSLRTFTSSYPSLDTIQASFKEETKKSSDGIQTEIEGIGPIYRTETRRIRDRLEESENVTVTGEGGIGKSGVLWQIANEWQSPVLFIDAGNHVTIDSEEMLAGRIGENGSLTDLRRSIQRLCLNKPVLLVIDQLDDVGPRAGQIFKEFIMAMSAVDNVVVVFACRTYDLQSRPELEELREAETFSTARQIGLLDRSEVEEYLDELSISNPPDEVIRLGRTIELLDIIAQLALEEADFSDISGEVSLWNRYRELLEDEEQLDDDTRTGSRVIAKAVEYAKAAIEETSDSVNIFQTGIDEDWADSILKTRNVIENVDQIGERRYRFRHIGFQQYLYAWDAVQRKRPISQVASEIDDRIGKNVFRFMFMLYVQEGGVEHLHEIPEGSDASTYAVEFITEVLDAETGLGDYAANTILDEVKTWDATANDEITDVVLENLEERETLRNYFFGNPPHPSWAIALRNRGQFQDPPNIFLAYLRNIAPEHPAIVEEVLPAVDTDDRHTLALVVTVIRELPVGHAANVVGLVEDSVTDGPPDWHSFQTAQLMEELIEGEEYEAAITLLRKIISPREPLEDETNHAQSVVELYNLQSTLSGNISRLVEHSGQEIVDIFEEELRIAVEIEAEVRDRQPDSVFGPIDAPITRVSIDNGNYYDLTSLLIDVLVIALDEWISLGNDNVRRNRLETYLSDITIFRRISMYLLRQHAEAYSKLIRETIVTVEHFENSLVKEDFLRLLREGFPLLSEEGQSRVINIIIDCPVSESIEANAEQRSERFEDYTAEEMANEAINRWVRDRLYVIKDHLPPDQIDYLDELIDEFGEPENVFSLVTTSGGFVAQESPVEVEEFLEQDPRDVIQYCIDEPFEERGWEETDSGRIREISSEGVAEAVAEAILHDSHRFGDEIIRLESANPVYTRSLFNGLRENVRHSEDIDINWSPFLALGKIVVSDTENWPEFARLSVARFLRDSLISELWEDVLEYAEQVKQLLFLLIEDPDPSEEREHPPEGHAGYDNPLQVAINSVRPIGVEALILFSRRIAEKRDYQGYSEEGDSGFDPDVREVVEGSIQGASLSVRSIIGRRLHLLWFLDQELVLANLSTLFPRSQNSQEIQQFAAAWDAYITNTNPQEGLFEPLRACYLHGIDLMVAGDNTAIQDAQRGISRHMLLVYLWDWEKPWEEDSIIGYLYDQGHSDIARQMAWQLWRWGKDDEGFRNRWEDVRRLWEWRLEQVDDPEVYAIEFQWYVEWLLLIKDQEPFEELIELIQNTLPFISYERRSWETLETYLVDQSIDYPEEVIQLYSELIEQEDRPEWLEFSDSTIAILERGVSAGGQTQRQALQIAEDYFSRGYTRAGEFLDAHT